MPLLPPLPELPPPEDRPAWLKALLDVVAAQAEVIQINFLGLLRSGHTDYVVNDAALAYMAGQKLPQSIVLPLMVEAAARNGAIVFADERDWLAALKDWGVDGQPHRGPRPLAVTRQ